MNHYFHNDAWRDRPDDSDDYGVFTGMRESEYEPAEQAWQEERRVRESRPADVEKPQRPYRNERLVKTVQNCGATCEYMTAHIMSMPDLRARTTQASLLRDCADICSLTAKILARNSVYSRQVSDICARVCRSCGNECAKFPDAMSQQCAKVCLETAGGCADYVTP